MKTRIEKTTRCLPCNYFYKEVPCMVCKDRTSGFRNDLRYLDDNGTQYCVIVLDTCLDCSELCPEDMVRKISYPKEVV